MKKDELVLAVVEQYLQSGDYNGLPAYSLTGSHSLDLEGLKELLRDLVRQGTLAVNFGEIHDNPHIRAFPDPSIEHQLEKLNDFEGDHFVIYPTPMLLAEHVDSAAYEGRPFSRKLAMGEPQLSYESFDPAVLENYRRDPRYRLWSNDVTVTLSISNLAFESESFPEKHKVMLQHFGFSFDSAFRRAVAVFLRDLSGLTHEHQQVWAAFMVEGDFKLHPDFYRAALLGDWGQKTSLSEAFLEEIRVINAMCEAIGWLPLFRQTLDVPPSDLAFLFLPTARAFNTFVHTLDKLMSENINQDFFPSKIPREIKVSRADGSVEIQHRGTIQLLEDWLQQSFRTQETSPLDDCLGTFRRVRKLRQKPAHALIEDTYDEALFKEQRDLFEAAYTAVRTLRLILQNHPAARKAADEMNEQVRNGEIWTI